MTYYFDFDHTLFDTDLFFHVHLRQALLTRFLIDESEWERTYEVLLSGGYSVERHLAELGVDQEKARDVLAWMRQRFSDLRPYVYTDVIPTFLELSKRGHVIHVLTAGNQAWQRYKVDGSGLRQYFSDLLIADDVPKIALLMSQGMAASDIVVDNDPTLLDAVRERFPDHKTFLVDRVPNHADPDGDPRRYLEARRYRIKRAAASHITITTLKSLL